MKILVSCPGNLHASHRKGSHTKTMYLSVILYCLHLQLITAHLGLQNTKRRLFLLNLVGPYLEGVNYFYFLRSSKSILKLNIELRFQMLYQIGSHTPILPLENALILLHYLHMESDIPEITLSWYGKRELRVATIDPVARTRQITDCSMRSIKVT